MSQTIDTKVVEMKFDNSNFESNVKQSQSTLEKLKKDLDMTGSADSFKNISNAVKDVSFDGISSGVNEAKSHFSALEEVAIGALRTVGEKVAEIGMQIAQELVINPPMEGFEQFEEKTKSVQTIMNATGQDIDTVSAALDKLMWFTDETSYSFSDMTNNIGKFTSMGIGLDDSVSAMMGISNWAAVSGAGINEASRAMYNLSQAMGVGAVKLQDWKSIENANMATAEFKQQVIDTAKEMGTLEENSNVTLQNFSSTLKDEWFTSEVLIEVLKDYAGYSDQVYERVLETGEACSEAMEYVSQYGDSFSEVAEKSFKAAQEAKTFTDAVEAVKDAVKSQWATLFEGVFGNYEEAKETWTDLANSLYEVFAQPLADVNEVFQEALSPKDVDLSMWNNLRDEIKTNLGYSNDDMKLFEKTLSNTAKQHGIDVDGMIEKWGSFAASVQNGNWLNSDIIQETVNAIKDGSAFIIDAMEDLPSLEDALGFDINKYNDRIGEINWSKPYSTFEEAYSEFANHLQGLIDSYGVDVGLTYLTELGFSAEDALLAINNLSAGLEAHQAIVDASSGVYGATSEKLSDLGDVVRRVLEGEFGDGEDRVKALTEAGWDYNEVQDAVVKTLRGEELTFNDLSDATLESLGYTEEQIEKLRSLADMADQAGTTLNDLYSYVDGATLRNNIWHNLFDDDDGVIVTYFDTFRETFSKVFGSLESGPIYDFLVKMEEKTAGLLDEDRVERFQNTLEKVFRVIHTIYTSIKGIFDVVKSIAGNTIVPVFKGFLDIILAIADGIGGLITGFDESGELAGFFADAIDDINRVLFPVKQTIEIVFGALTNFINALFRGQSFANAFKEAMYGVFVALDPNSGRTKFKKFTEFVGKVKDLGSQIGDTFKNIGETVSDAWKAFQNTELGQNITEFVDKIKDRISKAFSGIKDWFKKLFSGSEGDESNFDFFGEIKNALTGFNDWLDSIDFETIITGVSDFIMNAVDNIRNAFGKIRDVFDSIVNWFSNNAIVKFISDKFNEIRITLFGSTPEYMRLVRSDAPFGVWVHVTFEKIKKVFNDIVDWINNNTVIQIIANGFKDIWNSIFGSNDETDGASPFLTTLNNFFDKVKETFNNIADWLSKNKYVSYITDKFKALKDALLGKNDDSVGAEDVPFATRIKNAFEIIKGVFNDITNWLENTAVVQFIVDKFEKLKQTIHDIYDWLKNNAVVKFIADKLSELKDVIFSSQNSDGSEKEPFLTRVLNNLKAGLEWFNENLPSILDTIKQLLGAGALGGLIVVFLQIKNMFGGGLGIVKNINKVLSGLSNALNAFAFKELSTGVLMFSFAIVALAGALALLTLVDPNKLQTAAFALSAVGVAFGALAVGISKLMDSKAGLNKSKEKSTGLDAMLEGIGNGLQSLSESAGKYLKYKGISSMLFGVAAALGVMALAVYELAKLDLDDLGRGVLAVSGLITVVSIAMAGLMKASPATSFSMSIGKGGFSLDKSGVSQLSSMFGFIGMAAAMLIFVQVIDQIRQYSPSDLLMSVVTIGLIVTECSLAMRIAGGNFGVSSGLGMIAMAGALYLFVKEIDKIRGYSYNDILKGVITIGSIALECGLAMRIAGNSMGIGGGLSMIAMAYAIQIFVGVMKEIGDMNWTDIIKGVATISSLLIALGVASRLGNVTVILEGIGMALLGIAGAIAAITYAINSGVNFEELGTMFSAAATGLVQGFVDAITGSADSIIQGFITLIGTLVEYTPQIVNLLVDFVCGVLDTLSTRMSDIMGSVANFVQSLTDSFAEAFPNVDVSALTSAIQNMLLATAALALIGKISSFGSILKGAGALLATIGVFTAVMAAFGGLRELFGDGIVDFFSEATRMMGVIGEGIGNFLGGILGGTIGQAAESIGTHLPKLASDLSTFITNLDPFLKGVKEIDASVTTNIGYLTKAMLAISAGSFVDLLVTGLGKLFGQGDVTETYLDKFSALADAIIAFNSKIQGVDNWANTDIAAAAAAALGELIKVVPENGGALQKLVGFKDLVGAEEGFGAVGKGVANFCKAINDTTFNASTANSAADVISTLISTIPETGGWFQDIAGAKDLVGSEAGFKALGEGVAGFCKAIGDTTFNVDSASSAATVIATLIDTLPETGGILQNITGYKDLEGSAGGFEALGKGVSSFMKNLNGRTFTEADATTATNAIGVFNAIVEATPDTGGVWQDLFGGKDLGLSAQNFTELGNGIRDFCLAMDSLGGEGGVDLSDAKTAAEGIIEIMGLQWPEDHGVIGGFFVTLFEGTVDFAANTDKMNQLADGITNFCDTTKDIVIEDIEPAKTAATAISDIMNLQWPKTNGVVGDFFTQLFSGTVDFATNAQKMTDLGTGIKNFCDSTKDIKVDEVATAVVAAGSIKNIMNLQWPKTNGVVGDFFTTLFSGTVDFESNAFKMSQIGAGIKSFCSVTEGIVAEDVAAAKLAGEAIADLLSLDWPKTHGAVGDFFVTLFSGEVSWTNLSTQLPKMGEAVRGFADKMVGVSTSASVNAAICAGALEDVLSSISIYKNDLTYISTFNTNINDLMIIMAKFSTFATSLENTAITLAVSSINLLINILKTMAATDFSKAAGFSTALGELAETGIDEFTNKFTDSVDTVKKTVDNFILEITKALNIPKDFKDAGDKDGSSFNDGFSGWNDDAINTSNKIISDSTTALTQEQKFRDVGSTNGSGYNSGFSSWGAQIKITSDNIFNSMISALSSKVTFYSTGNDNGREFYNGFSSWNNMITTFASNLATGLITSLTQTSLFYNAGALDSGGFYNGFASYYTPTLTFAQTLASNAANSASNYEGFYSTGNYWGLGLYNGMQMYAYYIYQLAAQIAATAKAIADSTLGVASPSTEMFETGMYFDLGFANGILENAKYVKDASSNMAEDSLDVVKSTLSNINFDDLDDTLTLRPVLDLTDVQNGVSQINGMLDTENSIGINAIENIRLADSISKLNADVAQINGVYDDTDVLAVIADLGNRVDNLNDSINNIKLYLNGKTLVGGIVVDMDNALESLSNKKNKGVM